MFKKTVKITLLIGAAVIIALGIYFVIKINKIKDEIQNIINTTLETQELYTLQNFERFKCKGYFSITCKGGFELVLEHDVLKISDASIVFKRFTASSLEHQVDANIIFPYPENNSLLNHKLKLTGKSEILDKTKGITNLQNTLLLSNESSIGGFRFDIDVKSEDFAPKNLINPSAIKIHNLGFSGSFASKQAHKKIINQFFQSNNDEQFEQAVVGQSQILAVMLSQVIDPRNSNKIQDLTQLYVDLMIGKIKDFDLSFTALDPIFFNPPSHGKELELLSQIINSLTQKIEIKQSHF